jgi:hypothetical protein
MMNDVMEVPGCNFVAEGGECFLQLIGGTHVPDVPLSRGSQVEPI